VSAAHLARQPAATPLAVLDGGHAATRPLGRKNENRNLRCDHSPNKKAGAPSSTTKD
jgi:hypothetical protein